MAAFILFLLVSTANAASVFSPLHNELGLTERGNLVLNCNNNMGITNYCGSLGYFCSSGNVGSKNIKDSQCDQECNCGNPPRGCTVGPHGVTDCPEEKAIDSAETSVVDSTSDLVDVGNDNLEKRQVQYTFICYAYNIESRRLTEYCNRKGYVCYKGAIVRQSADTPVVRDCEAPKCQCLKNKVAQMPVYGCIGAASSFCCLLEVHDDENVYSADGKTYVGTLSNATVLANGTHVFNVDSGSSQAWLCA